jgi:succinate dehydrogenase/fumarate reductase flavoprotein subunit
MQHDGWGGEWGDEWERVADVIVVGSGAAAGAAAAIAAGASAEVLVLEKSEFTGGTTAKSGGVMWVPANPVMRTDGAADDRRAALRYMARTGYPAIYRSEHATLGLPDNTYQLLEAFYDSGAAVLDRLTELGAWTLEAVAYPDYGADLAEDEAPIGRVIQPAFPPGWRRGLDPTGGQLLADALLRVAIDQGAELRVGTQVVHVIKDESGRVIGVEARAGVRTVLYGARRGVIFGSGGFIHDPQLRQAFLRGPVLGGAASESATGDFVRIGIEAGAQLGNMTHAWWDQVAVEHAVTVPATIKDVYSPYGDSMLMVNKYGRRVVNEKAVYNERGQAHFAWDPGQYEYPNLLLFWIFDQAVCDEPTNDRFRWPIPMPGEPFPDFVFGADTLDELAVEIRRRVASLAEHTGGLSIADAFEEQLGSTVARFNEYARQGCDPEFRRGEASIERTWVRPAHAGMPNPTMAPLSDTGPYYCVILGPGALDTKGGPVIDRDARVLDVDGTPIPGLYGAGNCIASPAGQAYWGPGGTIGPAIVFGGIAAGHAVGGNGA